METTHRVFVGDSRDLSEIADESVELVVTSPPYPMIEMWDDLFCSLDADIEAALEDDGPKAFELMHDALAETWAELPRVLVDGAIVCINVGDATRTVDGSFRVYQNHARILERLEELGFEPLPDILWRKPANSAATFMGSGMIPPNAYATLEHEYVLVFRYGSTRRTFESGSRRRYESAYFWEERNEWFSDLWSDVRGAFQTLEGEDLRERSAAYPFEIPYRLINMYSVYGDTILDPFWGTGTTSLAAMIAGRNSVGYELDDALVDAFEASVADVEARSERVVRARLARHESFVERRRSEGNSFEYEAEHYDFPVTTNQERRLRLYTVDAFERTDSGYSLVHSPADGDACRFDPADG